MPDKHRPDSLSGRRETPGALIASVAVFLLSSVVAVSWSIAGSPGEHSGPSSPAEHQTSPAQGSQSSDEDARNREGGAVKDISCVMVLDPSEAAALGEDPTKFPTPDPSECSTTTRHP